VFENFDEKGMTFPSEQALRDYCKKHQKISGALL
jgi:hypothetical protein